MTRIVTLMGGSAENVAWLPGVGDQYVTCAGGRTIRLGRLLGAGLTYTEAVLEMAGETLEGAYVIKQIGPGAAGMGSARAARAARTAPAADALPRDRRGSAGGDPVRQAVRLR